MKTMRAVRAHTRGGADKLRLEQAPVPVPGRDDVLVEVHAAAITFDELLWDESWTRAGVDRTPVIPSHEVSGTVIARGDAVTDVELGEEIYALIEFDRDGAAADFVAVRADDCAVKPRTVDHVHAAALPLAALTAWQALLDHAALTAGESVLVLGGAGGVGAYVVQLAHHFGAQVTATVSDTESIDYVTALGADRVTVKTIDAEFDIIIDTVGGPALAAAYPHVRQGGRLVTLSAPPEPELKNGRDVHDTFFVVRPDRKALDQLATLVDAGTIKPLVGAVCDLGDAPAAYADRGRHGGPGKRILRVR
jgi:NADPH:quinone reductase-like Zn-dependent oxidoreductase